MAGFEDQLEANDGCDIRYLSGTWTTGKPLRIDDLCFCQGLAVQHYSTGYRVMGMKGWHILVGSGEGYSHLDSHRHEGNVDCLVVTIGKSA